MLDYWWSLIRIKGVFNLSELLFACIHSLAITSVALSGAYGMLVSYVAGFSYNACSIIAWPDFENHGFVYKWSFMQYNIYGRKHLYVFQTKKICTSATRRNIAKSMKGII